MQILKQRLAQLASLGLERHLTINKGVDLSSNDYLGFAIDPVLKQKIEIAQKALPNGSSGSRLLSGNSEYFLEVEDQLAKWTKRESALVFASGYQANLALLSSLLTENDSVFSDALNHASIIDGIRLTKASKYIYPHRDLNALERLLQKNSSNNLKIIVTESLFGMDGTLAPLESLLKLAEQYHAYLIVDEAHSTGIWQNCLTADLSRSEHLLASVHCGGKALGVSGAWISSNKLVKDYLINLARPAIFSTAPIPALFAALQQSILHHQEVGQERANTVLQRSQQFRDLLAGKNDGLQQGPIVSVVLGSTENALNCASYLKQCGWNVRAIRPPTVPENTSRLRLTVKWSNSEEELNRFVEDVKRFS